MFEFLHSRNSMSCTNCFLGSWLFFVLCFTDSFVTVSNQPKNAANTPSTIITEVPLSDKGMSSVEPTLRETTYDGHKLQCTEEERQRVSCLNGNCFAVDLNPRVAGCACLSGWTGDRCQLMEIPPEFWEASSIVGLIVGLVACATVVVISLLIFYIKRRQSRRHSHEPIDAQDHRDSSRKEGAHVPLKEGASGMPG